jgi:hypothetical protein
MKNKKAKIFKLLKEIIVEGEINIHKQMKEDGTNKQTIKHHSKVIKELKKCSTMDELLIVMGEDFSMDYTEVIETYIM